MLQTRKQAGVEQRRLADTRLTAEQDDRGRIAANDAMVQIADLAASTEEHLGMFAAKPVQMPKGRLGQILQGQRRQAEQRIVGRLRQVPIAGRLGARPALHRPRPPVRIDRRGPIPVAEIQRPRLRAASRRDTRHRFLKRTCNARPARQALIELARKIRRHAVVDRPRRRDHRRDIRVQQSLRLLLSRTAVQKHQLQPPLLAQKRRQPARVGGRRLTRGRFQQQLIPVGMSAVMEDRDAVAVSRILKHLEDVPRRAVRPHHHLAQPGPFRRLQNLPHPPRFLGQVPQITDGVVAVVGKRQEDDRLRGCVGHGASLVVLAFLLYSAFSLPLARARRRSPDLAGTALLGAGLPTSPELLTVGLPKRRAVRQFPGDLRSEWCAGSGDPRTALRAARRRSPDLAGPADRRSPEAAHGAAILGELRSEPCAGSGDPRTASAAPCSAQVSRPRRTC
jgi:hypothetical protein